MTLRDTTCTLADAKATAVSAMTSAFTDPRPPVALAWNKNNADYGWLVIEYSVVKLWISLSGLTRDA